MCLLGDGDTIVKWLCDELAKTDLDGQGTPTWDLDKEVPVSAKPATKTNGGGCPAVEEGKPDSAANTEANGASIATAGPEQVGNSHVWLFPGANRESRWVESVRRAYGSDAEDDDEENGNNSEDGDKPVELPASLAPGVIEGEGSDGPDSVSDDDDDVASNAGATGSEHVLADSLDERTVPSAAATETELQRIAPSFLHSAADLA